MAPLTRVIFAFSVGFLIVGFIRTRELLHPGDGAERRAWKTDFSVPDSWPVLLARLGAVFAARNVHRYMASPPRLVSNDLLTLLQPSVVNTIAQLAIPDLLASHRATASELASSLSLPPSAAGKLQRLLTAASALGYLREDAHGAWHNTPQSVLLTETHPSSVKPLVLLHCQLGFFSPWHHLTDCLQGRSGNHSSCFSWLHGGQSVWDRLEASETAQEQFGAAMASVDVLASYGAIHDFDWSRFSRVIDVAGNEGSFLEGILRAHPHLRGAIFDLPDVIERNTQRVWGTKPQALQQRVELVSGSFFNASSLPRGRPGDAFVLRSVLHNWPDADATSILQSLRAAVGSSGAALLVVEALPRRKERDSSRLAMDLHMMLLFGSGDRGEEEMGALLAAAGFRRRAVADVRSVWRVMEAEAV